MIERYKFCVWLLDRLSRGGMTFREIEEEWNDASANDGKMPLTSRTFLRYRNIAEELFNVNIDCHKPSNEYRLDTTSMKEIDRWSLSALRMHSLSSISDLRKVIMLEPPPAGSELVRQLADACNEQREVTVRYKSPYQPERNFTLIPYFLRLFKQRWYLIGRQPGKDYDTTLALERIRDVNIGERRTDNSSHLSPEDYFEDCYGVIKQFEPERIIIRAFNPQDAYIKEVPIHSSQRVVEETPDWTDFSLYVRPTYDFKQELLSQRDKLTVISPEWLRQDMIDIIERMLRSYQTGNSFYKDE